MKEGVRDFCDAQTQKKRRAVNLIMAPGQNDSSWAALWLRTQSSIRPGLSCNYIFFMWIQLGREERPVSTLRRGMIGKEESKEGFFFSLSEGIEI